MLKRKGVLMVDLYEVINKFTELSGWESLQDGQWNGRWNKEVAYDIEYYEGDSYQREQNYVFIDDGPDDLRINFNNAPQDGIITLDFIKAVSASHTYTDRNNEDHPYIVVSFGHILHYLREVGELPWDTTLIITNRAF